MLIRGCKWQLKIEKKGKAPVFNKKSHFFIFYFGQLRLSSLSPTAWTVTHPLSGPSIKWSWLTATLRWKIIHLTYQTQKNDFNFTSPTSWKRPSCTLLNKNRSKSHLPNQTCLLFHLDTKPVHMDALAGRRQTHRLAGHQSSRPFLGWAPAHKPRNIIWLFKLQFYFCDIIYKNWIHIN